VADKNGWPDPDHPGWPIDPRQEGPHLVVDQYGKRRWYLWMTNGTWFRGGNSCSAGWAGRDWTYIGPAVAPDGGPVSG
jgi:hypothetical protein